MKIRPRNAVKLGAAVVVVGLAVSACSSTRLGAAALAGNDRITTGNLTAQVANLNAAYKTDKVKGVKPQRATGQESQQVLTWLLTFRIFDKLAAQRRITVTPAQAQTQIDGLATQAKQSKVNLDEYVSAGGALPPDLVPQLGQYFAILSVLEKQLDGGKTPTSQSAETNLENQVGHAQCLAAKSLSVKVNPQYGQFDYRSYSVVPAPPTLAAGPTPSASATPALVHPPC
jgi:hypothetical protein